MRARRVVPMPALLTPLQAKLPDHPAAVDPLGVVIDHYVGERGQYLFVGHRRLLLSRIDIHYPNNVRLC